MRALTMAAIVLLRRSLPRTDGLLSSGSVMLTVGNATKYLY